MLPRIGLERMRRRVRFNRRRFTETGYVVLWCALAFVGISFFVWVFGQ